MSLDVTFTAYKPLLCPHCGEVVKQEVVDCADSNGREWYPFLESIGYYVPYDQRNEKNDWYGKDMTLTTEQVQELCRFTKEHDASLYYGHSIRVLAMAALIDDDTVVVNADC